MRQYSEEAVEMLRLNVAAESLGLFSRYWVQNTIRRLAILKKDFHTSFKYLQENYVRVQLGHGNFVPCPSQFINHSIIGRCID
jgi:hypothetical protein